jgi:hypothetical protein
MTASMHTLSFSGDILERGFWLYVWEVTKADKDVVLYVDRTGDNSSPNAQSPYIRMGQHLGSGKSTNMLRTHLEKKGVDPTSCKSFELIAYGPILTEVKTMEEHMPLRDKVAALEKKLRDALADAGYAVLNKVNCWGTIDPELWREVRAAFSERFPKLSEHAQAATSRER